MEMASKVGAAQDDAAEEPFVGSLDSGLRFECFRV